MEKYFGLKDEELVKMAKTGDEGALAVIFDKYKSIVKIKAQLHYIPGGDHDDVIQEGMIGLFQAVRDYSEGKGASFNSFAQLCIDRHIAMAIRKAASLKNSPLNTSVPILDAEEANEGAMAESPESILIDKENAENVISELKSTLSSLEAEVLKLMLKEHTYTEIAEILQVSVKTADNAIQRIKRKLKIAKGEATK